MIHGWKPFLVFWFLVFAGIPVVVYIASLIAG